MIDTKQVAARMTELLRNQRRFIDVKWTRAFGGVSICYYDAARRIYCIETILDGPGAEVLEKTNDQTEGGEKVDVNSDRLLESCRAGESEQGEGSGNGKSEQGQRNRNKQV